MDDLIAKPTFMDYMHQNANLARNQSKAIVSMLWDLNGILNIFRAPIAKNPSTDLPSLSLMASLIAKLTITNKPDPCALDAVNQLLVDVSMPWERNGTLNTLCALSA